MNKQQAELFMARSLAKREQSAKQIERKLKERGTAPQLIEELIREFQEKGYLDDARWLENRVSSLKKSRKGPKRIAQQLQLEGLSCGQARGVAMMGREEEKEAIEALLSSRYAKRDLRERKERDKVVAALCRRGFSVAVILDVISGWMKR